MESVLRSIKYLEIRNFLTRRKRKQVSAQDFPDVPFQDLVKRQAQERLFFFRYVRACQTPLDPRYNICRAVCIESIDLKEPVQIDRLKGLADFNSWLRFLYGFMFRWTGLGRPSAYSRRFCGGSGLRLRGCLAFSWF